MSVVRGREHVLTPFCLDKPGIVYVSSSFLVAVHDRAQVLVIPPGSADGPVSRLMDLRAVWKQITRLHALLLECCVIFVNRVGTEGEMVFWAGPAGWIPRPGGRRGSLYTEQLADLDLAEIALPPGDPLLENPGSISSGRSRAA